MCHFCKDTHICTHVCAHTHKTTCTHICTHIHHTHTQTHTHTSAAVLRPLMVCSLPVATLPPLPQCRWSWTALNCHGNPPMPIQLGRGIITGKGGREGGAPGGDIDGGYHYHLNSRRVDWHVFIRLRKRQCKESLKKQHDAYRSFPVRLFQSCEDNGHM